MPQAQKPLAAEVARFRLKIANLNVVGWKGDRPSGQSALKSKEACPSIRKMLRAGNDRYAGVPESG